MLLKKYFKTKMEVKELKNLDRLEMFDIAPG